MKKVYLLATVMAIITGFAVYLFANTLKQETIIQSVETAEVVVCISDIPENTVITEQMVMVKRLPVESVLANTAKTTEEVIGRINKYPLFGGEQILLSKFSELGNQNAAELSYELKEGERAITVPVNEIIGIAGFIKKGDYVDIISTVSKEGQVTSSIILEKIKVIKTGNKTENAMGNQIIQYTSVTLCMTSDQTLILSSAMNDSVIRLSLRPLK